MPQESSIEWTDYTSNPIYFVDTRTMKRGWFCVHCSAGCENCYAEQQNKLYNIERNTGRGNGLEFKAQNKQFIQAVMNEAELEAIIKLNKRLEKKGETKKLFCFDMTDLFGDFIPDEMRDAFFAVVAICRNIHFQILTKRAKEMRDYFNADSLVLRWSVAIEKLTGRTDESFEIIQRHSSGKLAPFLNLWLGVSVEDQLNANKRVVDLIQTPAAIRFLSVEPLIAEVKLNRLCETDYNYLDSLTTIDWVIVGGESGSKARTTHIEHIRSVVQQCKAANVPVFVKQLGAWVCEGWKTQTLPPLQLRHNGKKVFPFLNLKDRKGGDITEFPPDLQVREFPNVEVVNA